MYTSYQVCETATQQFPVRAKGITSKANQQTRCTLKHTYANECQVWLCAHHLQVTDNGLLEMFAGTVYKSSLTFTASKQILSSLLRPLQYSGTPSIATESHLVLHLQFLLLLDNSTASVLRQATCCTYYFFPVLFHLFAVFLPRERQKPVGY